MARFLLTAFLHMEAVMYVLLLMSTQSSCVEKTFLFWTKEALDERLPSLLAHYTKCIAFAYFQEMTVL